MAQISNGKAAMPNLVPIRQSERSTRGKSDTLRGREKVSRVHSEEQEVLLVKQPLRGSGPESVIFDGPSGIHHVNMSMKNSMMLGEANLISHIHGAAPYGGDMSSMAALEKDMREHPYDPTGTSNLLSQLKLDEMRNSGGDRKALGTMSSQMRFSGKDHKWLPEKKSNR